LYNFYFFFILDKYLIFTLFFIKLIIDFSDLYLNNITTILHLIHVKLILNDDIIFINLNKMSKVYVDLIFEFKDLIVDIKYNKWLVYV
jgi:hypothetical protein